MEAEFTSVRENPLLDRFEVEVKLEHQDESTPSEEDVVSRIAAENNLDKDAIQVEGIYTGFGSNTSRAELKITEDFEYSEDEESTVEEHPEEPETSEEQKVEEPSDIDYIEIVSGTISDAKDALKELENPDWKAALEAEKDNKDRKTFKEWLENRQ